MEKEPAAKKQLRRSSTNRSISGVCGGIAEYFEVDPVLVRIVFILAVFGLGVSILVYPLLWLVMPEE